MAKDLEDLADRYRTYRYIQQRFGDLPVTLIREFGCVFSILLSKILQKEPLSTTIEDYANLVLELKKDMIYLENQVRDTLSAVEELNNRQKERKEALSEIFSTFNSSKNEPLN